MYITYYIDIKNVYLSTYSHSDKTTECRIDINYKSTTILVKTISTLGLVSEYHEFFHHDETNRLVYFVTNKQTYLTVGNGHHFLGEAWYMRL